MTDYTDTENYDEPSNPTPYEHMKQMALFLLKTKEIRKVSQSALEGIITDFTLILQQSIHTLKSDVNKCLSASGVSISTFDGLGDIYGGRERLICSPFRGCRPSPFTVPRLSTLTVHRSAAGDLHHSPFRASPFRDCRPSPFGASPFTVRRFKAESPFTVRRSSIVNLHHSPFTVRRLSTFTVHPSVADNLHCSQSSRCHLLFNVPD